MRALEHSRREASCTPPPLGATPSPDYDSGRAILYKPTTVVSRTLPRVRHSWPPTPPHRRRRYRVGGATPDAEGKVLLAGLRLAALPMREALDAAFCTLPEYFRLYLVRVYTRPCRPSAPLPRAPPPLRPSPRAASTFFSAMLILSSLILPFSVSVWRGAAGGLVLLV